jgi:hypothetical protein
MGSIRPPRGYLTLRVGPQAISSSGIEYQEGKFAINCAELDGPAGDFNYTVYGEWKVEYV